MEDRSNIVLSSDCQLSRLYISAKIVQSSVVVYSSGFLNFDILLICINFRNIGLKSTDLHSMDRPITPTDQQINRHEGSKGKHTYNMELKCKEIDHILLEKSYAIENMFTFQLSAV